MRQHEYMYGVGRIFNVSFNVSFSQAQDCCFPSMCLDALERFGTSVDGYCSCSRACLGYRCARRLPESTAVAWGVCRPALAARCIDSLTWRSRPSTKLQSTPALTGVSLPLAMMCCAVLRVWFMMRGNRPASESFLRARDADSVRALHALPGGAH